MKWTVSISLMKSRSFVSARPPQHQPVLTDKHLDEFSPEWKRIGSRQFFWGLEIIATAWNHTKAATHSLKEIVPEESKSIPIKSSCAFKQAHSVDKLWSEFTDLPWFASVLNSFSCEVSEGIQRQVGRPCDFPCKTSQPLVADFSDLETPLEQMSSGSNIPGSWRALWKPSKSNSPADSRVQWKHILHLQMANKCKQYAWITREELWLTCDIGLTVILWPQDLLGWKHPRHPQKGTRKMPSQTICKACQAIIALSLSLSLQKLAY